MSQSSASQSKKRKQADVGEGNSSTLHKKAKNVVKEKKVDRKGKGREKQSGEFQVVNASVVVSIPPVFANNPMSGVNEMLDSLVMRYVPALGGVMLCHSNARFISQSASIKLECPFGVCTVGFDANVWSPQIGMNLTGKINLCSPDHISLLVHRTFNVSIPRHHIVTDSWEFEHGPADNDPEFGPSAGKMEDVEEESPYMDVEGNALGVDDDVEVGGKWVHKITGDLLGGEERLLEFTVIGLKVANQMLSLVGSLQLDPFSEEHVPQLAIVSSQTRIAEEEVQSQTEEELNEDNEDAFALLGKQAAAKEAKQAEEKVTAEKTRKKEKKEKRRKEKSGTEKQDGPDEIEGVGHAKRRRKKSVKEE